MSGMREGKIGLAGFLLAAFLLAGCGKGENNATVSPADTDRKIQIGMSFDSFVIERWQRDRDVFVSMAKELGAEVNVQNANGDIEEQKRQIDYLIEKDMDVIVIICIDSGSLSDSVKRAKDAGIKIIAYDRLITNADIDLYISFDNETVGEMMAQAFVDAGIGAGPVLMLGGPLADNNVSLVENGFRRICEENEVEILDSIHAEGWRAEVAAEYIYQNMEVVSEAAGIMCGNDNLATFAVHALAEKRMAGEVLVVGQDAELEACQRVVEGTQLMTVYKPVEKLAQRAAECAVALARGEAVDGNDVAMLDNGKYRVPYIGLEPIRVGRENINDMIIGSGFHLKEDVYLNVPEQMPK